MAVTSSAFPSAKELPAPQTPKKAVKVEQHGVERTDDYAWLRDDNWQEVLRDPSKLDADVRKALEAENAYYEQLTDALAPLRETLMKEMRGRIKENDASVPMTDGDWRYWSEFREGGEYPIFKRSRLDGSEETVLFDGDAEGKGEAFFDIGDIAHSPNQDLIAIAVDRVGSEYYKIETRNAATGEVVGEVIESADEGGAIWASDSSGFFYVERDDNQRAKWVKFHRLGEDPSKDRLIYEEEDDGFYMGLSKSQSGDFVFIGCSSPNSSEVQYLRADDPLSPPVMIEPRTPDVKYSVEHRGDHFYIHTNADGAVDFKIMRTSVAAPQRAHWQEWEAHEAGRYILDIILFKERIVWLERRDALPGIVVSDYDGDRHDIRFEEEAYSLGVSAGYEFDTTTLRFNYESPSTPRQTFDYDMTARTRTLLKTQEVPSGHDPSKYVVERIIAQADDGAEIPVTILRLKSTPVDGSAGVLLYGYGSYGITIPAAFSTNLLSVVDRGVIYAIAHIRGGAARGRQWYLDGKLDKKMNTFTDFNRAAETLVEKGYAAKKRIVIYGGSAGGLLVGACVNLRPELYAGVIAAVPFVDVINTISDASLPLTPPEWEEWGNPIDSAEAYADIATYSPYDNVRDAHYPPILATGGLTDYRVTYWEPAKWIARLREVAKAGPFALRMNMGAGHGGSAARFEQLDERAHLFAFALRALQADR